MDESMFDRFPWLGWAVVIAIEAAALAIGVALCHFGYVAWYVVPLFLLVPPALALVAGLLGLANAESNGENPFQ